MNKVFADLINQLYENSGEYEVPKEFNECLLYLLPKKEIGTYQNEPAYTAERLRPIKCSKLRG